MSMSMNINRVTTTALTTSTTTTVVAGIGAATAEITRGLKNETSEERTRKECSEMRISSSELDTDATSFGTEEHGGTASQQCSEGNTMAAVGLMSNPPARFLDDNDCAKVHRSDNQQSENSNTEMSAILDKKTCHELFYAKDKDIAFATKKKFGNEIGKNINADTLYNIMKGIVMMDVESSQSLKDTTLIKVNDLIKGIKKHQGDSKLGFIWFIKEMNEPSLGNLQVRPSTVYAQLIEHVGKVAADNFAKIVKENLK